MHRHVLEWASDGSQESTQKIQDLENILVGPLYTVQTKVENDPDDDWVIEGLRPPAWW